MYSVIWKYPLLLTDEQTITMPQHAAPLYVDIQGDTLCLWAMVDPKAESVPQKVHVYGTGNPIDAARSDEYHIGSVQHVLRGQPFVWHVFWVVE